jgi:NADH dehydrogenase
VHTNARVTGIDADGVECEASIATAARTRERIAARTVIWAAGVAGSPLGAELARGTGAALDRAGRIVVEPDLSLAGIPRSRSSATSRARSATARTARDRCPGVSPAAKQMGRAAAAQRRPAGARRPTIPFRYRDYGNLATVGRKAAVVELAVPASARFASPASARGSSGCSRTSTS